ncbi:MAG: DEAD/DEAH box helicase family protein [Deltaproteobacteria bacterium]|nr:DEAD/DEAH box helicase family protein [Deltaproteobacteria bacterium]MBW2045292.1 DEAD/DEAH box helicase family protein [Deltaproteobacteria bacterium]
METMISLKDFLNDYGESMAEKIIRELNVIHDPTKEKDFEISNDLKNMKKMPFPSQAEIIKACYKSIISWTKAVYIVSECGTGKTLMAIGTALLLFKLKNIRRALVVCPPHLVPKWIQEIKDSLSGAKAYNLNGRDVIKQLENLRRQPIPGNLQFYIIGRERAKTGFIWRPAVVRRHGRHFCPKCGSELLDKDGYPLSIFEKNTQARYKKKHSCNNKVIKWKYNTDTDQHQKLESICGEQLWQPDNTRKSYRKAIPAKFIKKKMKGFFDLFIADEVHEFKNESGQGYAFGALTYACKYVLCLTGTIAGGYASDVYHLLFRTHPQFMLQDNNRWGNPKRFIEKYGVLEKITTVKEEDGLTTKAKRRTIVKEKSGISPLLLGKILLSNSVFLRLSDCIEHLQPYEEDVIELSMHPQMAQLYADFEETMKKALREALIKGDNSLLGAYLHALLSYPERIYKGLEVVHPHSKEPVAYGPPLQGVMPKEHELISIIKTELEQKRKVLVYIQNSNTTDISPRLVEMLEEKNIKVKVLRSGDTEARAKIIDRWLKKGMEVLITNPKKVEVGMDLLDFPSIVFYQIPMSTYTLRQASRRSWRIPQKKPVKVYFLTYSGTMQTRLMQLMADKLMCSLAIEGELTDKGLAALSETSDSMAKELAKMLIEKSEDNRKLKDIWAQYRKKEVQVELKITKDITEPETELKTLSKEEKDAPGPGIKKASSEIEKIGDRIVKVQFIEYIGKRKKKVTHIEVKQEDLEDMLKKNDRPVQAQFTLF